MESLQNYAPQRPYAGGREDCWSEGATEALIEAWGDRYLQLSRGNLRRKDWKEVAHAVNSRQNGVKPQRTDVQCKNRIDTLKKKYKLEKAKPSPSKWLFYNRLHYLIAVNTTPLTLLNKKSGTKFTLSAVKSESNPNLNSNGVLDSGRSDESSDGDDGEVRSQRHKDVELLEEETTAYKELARAILRFGEIYERIESAKQQQMMELEKQRLEFTKDLEFRRMNVFMEAQLQLVKLKRPSKNSSGSGKLCFFQWLIWWLIFFCLIKVNELKMSNLNTWTLLLTDSNLKIFSGPITAGLKLTGVT